MDLIDIVTKAIELQKPICFEYTKFGKVLGERFGHPHCLFIHPSTNNVMMHVFQVSGVSDTKEKIPGWRAHILKNIDRVTVLHEGACFKIAVGYNPKSYMYSRVISKI